MRLLPCELRPGFAGPEPGSHTHGHSAALRGEVCDPMAVGPGGVGEAVEDPAGVEKVLTGEPPEACGDPLAEGNHESVRYRGEFRGQQPGEEIGEDRSAGGGGASRVVAAVAVDGVAQRRGGM